MKRMKKDEKDKNPISFFLSCVSFFILFILVNRIACEEKKMGDVPKVVGSFH
jgi:hypothetical protein